jgi:hypothetical protein
MADRRQLEFFLLRYVPNVAREEFVNIGVVLMESGGDGGGFADVHFTADWRRARCIDPNVDVEMLEALGREIAMRLKDVPQRGLLLHEMMDSYSNTLQLSPITRCVADNPAEELKTLARMLVEVPTISGVHEKLPPKKAGRRWIYAGMREAFRSARIWDFLIRDLAASDYTNPEDDFSFDFAYPLRDELRILHAVSLAEVGLETQMFPGRVAQIAPRIKARKQVFPSFTAVVEDQFDEGNKAVKKVLASMADENIRVRRLEEMPRIAADARNELRA